jgi:hypothetical protein
MERKRITKKFLKLENLKEAAENFKYAYKPNIVDLVKNAEECKKATENTCWRPDIYLNNDRHCDNCKLVEHCGCSLKQLSKKKKK